MSTADGGWQMGHNPNDSRGAGLSLTSILILSCAMLAVVVAALHSLLARD